MSPSDLQVLIYCYALAETHPRFEHLDEDEGIKRFIADGIIEPDCTKKGRWTTTPKGRAWMRAILDTPVPRLAWVGEDNKILTVELSEAQWKEINQ